MNHKISSLALSYIITKAVMFGLFTNLIIHLSGTSSIISVAIGSILSIALVLLGIYFRPKLIYNKPFKCLLIFYSITIIILLLCNMIHFLSSVILFDTPIWFIGLLLIIPLIYICRLNQNTIYYMCNIIFVISILLFFIYHTGSIPHIDIYSFNPININNNTYLAALILPLVTLFNLFPLIYLDNQFYCAKCIITGFILALICNLATIFSIISILGIYLTKLYSFPEYMSYMRINFFFIDRFENFMLIALIFNFIILMSFHIFSIKKRLTAC